MLLWFNDATLPKKPFLSMPVWVDLNFNRYDEWNYLNNVRVNMTTQILQQRAQRSLASVLKADFKLSVESH